MKDELKIITPNSSRKDMLAHIHALEARLECDRVYTYPDPLSGSFVEKTLSPRERNRMIQMDCDGIGCRDMTIRMLEERIAAYEQIAREGKTAASSDKETRPGFYPLQACLWFRESTQEWILEISGEIDDTSLRCRHTQPADVAPADAPGLPRLYAFEENIRALIDPVIAWYQSDEQANRDTGAILGDIVADLQDDRERLLRLERAHREAIALLQADQPDPHAALKRLAREK